MGLLNWARRAADHLSSFSAEVKNKWSFTSTPAFVAWTGTTLNYRLYSKYMNTTTYLINVV